MATELFENNISFRLAAGCAAGDTTLVLDGTVPTALQAIGGQWRALISDSFGSEYVIVPGGQAGPTVTGVTRGAEGTAATSHSQGTYVTHMLTASAILNAGAGQFTSLGNVTTAVTLNALKRLAGTFTFVLTAATCAITVINAVAGSELVIIPFQDGSPPRLITHPAAVAWTSTGPPTLSSNANAPDRFQYTVLAVDGAGNPTRIVGSLGFTSGSAPQPINPPVIT